MSLVMLGPREGTPSAPYARPALALTIVGTVMAIAAAQSAAWTAVVTAARTGVSKGK